MAKYALTLNKKGRILSFNVSDNSTAEVSLREMIGNHFSQLIGARRKDLEEILREISKTKQPGTFQTYFNPLGTIVGPVVEWRVEPMEVNFFTSSRFVLTGQEAAA